MTDASAILLCLSTLLSESGRPEHFTAPELATLSSALSASLERFGSAWLSWQTALSESSLVFDLGTLGRPLKDLHDAACRLLAEFAAVRGAVAAPVLTREHAAILAGLVASQIEWAKDVDYMSLPESERQRVLPESPASSCADLVLS